jgi:hypothetical protein
MTMTILFLLLLLCILPLSSLSEYEEEPVEMLPPPTRFSDCICEDDSCEQHNVQTGLARIAYLVTVHNDRTLEDATPLFRAIRSSHNLIFIHVDAKLDMQVYYDSSLYQEITECPCGSPVVVDSVHAAEWSSWSMNDPTFWGMEQALLQRENWDVFINLSGDSLPVYNQAVIGRLFASELKGINFVTSSSCETGLLPTNVYHFPEWWHKRKHYTNYPDGDVVLDYVDENGQTQSITMQIYFGSQWVALTPDFCDFVVTSLARDDSLASRFRDYLIESERLMTDETLLATLLMHVLPFSTTVPTIFQTNGTLVTRPEMAALRYERMDEHAPTAFGVLPHQQHYDVPDSSEADPPKPWGPYFLGIYDLRAIRESGALYIRKVSQFVEPNLYQVLPVSIREEIPDLYWPDEVQISVKVDWRKRIKELKRRIREEEQTEGGDL